MPYKNQYEIYEIWRVFQDNGVILPEDLSTSMSINNRLESILEDLADMSYDDGYFSCPCDGDYQ